MNSIARLYQDQGKYAQAAARYATVLEFRRRVLGAEHSLTMNTLASIGEVELQQQRYAAAESSFRDVLKTYEKTSSDNWERYKGQSMLGASLAGQKQYAAAEPLLVSGYEGIIQRQATIAAANRSVIEQTRQRIVQLYLEWGKPEKAAEWQHKPETGNPGGAH